MDVHVQAEVVLVVVLVRDRPFSRDKIDLFENKNILGTENLCVLFPLSPIIGAEQRNAIRRENRTEWRREKLGEWDK